MITQNYRTFLSYIFNGENGDPRVTNTSGLSRYLVSLVVAFPSAGLLNKYSSTSSNDYAGIFFGAGTTPPSSSDYTLENQIISNLEIGFPESHRRITNADGKTLYTATYTLRNIGDSNLVIGEIGLVTNMNTKQYTYETKGESTPVLIDRTVLEEPLIIPPGEIRALTYNLEFDLNFE